MTNKDEREFLTRSERLKAKQNQQDETQEFASFDDYKNFDTIEYEDLYQDLDLKEQDQVAQAQVEASSEEEQAFSSRRAETVSSDSLARSRQEQRNPDNQASKGRSRLSTAWEQVKQKLDFPKNWATVSIAAVVAVLLLMIVIAIFIPKNKTDQVAVEESEISVESSEESSEESSKESSEESESSKESSETEAETAPESSAQAPVVQNIPADGQVESSSYAPPAQASGGSGSHMTDYSEGSSDRLAIKSAASAVTGINQDSMIEHWVGHDGSSNGVYATVSDGSGGQQYRVHVKWVEGAGWQPSGVEPVQ